MSAPDGAKASPETAIGMVGLGQMGGRIAARLVDHGYSVSGFDVDDAILARAVAGGVNACRSVAAVAAASNVVLLSLPTPEIVRKVVLGADGIVATGGVDCVIDLSTTGYQVSSEIGRLLADAGIDVIDAPVSGGINGAEAGTLTIMAAAPAHVVAAHRGLLDLIGRRIFHVGDVPGQGQVMKLVNNMISSAAMVATAEGMAIGVKAGLDPVVMLDVLNASTGRNSHTEDKFPNYIVPRTFDFGFSMGLLYKDVRLALALAADLGTPTLVTGTSAQVWGIAIGQGGADQDMTSVAQLIEQWAGVTIESAPSGPEEERG